MHVKGLAKAWLTCLVLSVLKIVRFCLKYPVENSLTDKLMERIIILLRDMCKTYKNKKNKKHICLGLSSVFRLFFSDLTK